MAQVTDSSWQTMHRYLRADYGLIPIPNVDNKILELRLVIQSTEKKSYLIMKILYKFLYKFHLIILYTLQIFIFEGERTKSTWG